MNEDIAPSGGQGQLERRATLLLRAYPAAYRAAWGEEILGTLLEATPAGRKWPPARHQVSVLGAGLSARRRSNARLAAAGGVRQAAVLGIALYISSALSSELNRLSFPWWSSGPLGLNVIAPFVPLAATLLLAWSGRRALVATAALVSGGVLACQAFNIGLLGPDRLGATNPALVLTVPLLLLAALVYLTRTTQPPPMPWLLIPCLPVALAGLSVIAVRLRLDPVAALAGRLSYWPTTFSPVTGLSALLMVITICWLITDVRPLLGLALGLTIMASGTEFSDLVTGSGGMAFEIVLQLMELAVPVVVASVLVWLLRRRTGPLPSLT